MLGFWCYEINACIGQLIRVERTRRGPARDNDMLANASDLFRPFVRETRDFKSLHFSMSEMQSQMLKLEPHTLLADYTRTMMGFLIFDGQPRRVAMIGLGGGSLAKFCYRELPHSRIDVVEINPHVVALREEFHVPPDDERFQVHLDDGARFVGQSTNQFDVLLVDAYTRDGIPSRLASSEFYDNCRNALTDSGIMVLNLYCDDSDAHIDRIRQSFAGSVFVVDEIEDANRVVFACAGSAASSRPTIPICPPAHLRRSASSLLKPAFSRIALAMRAQCPAKSRPTRRLQSGKDFGRRA
ncbi:MAG: fused MFS/spermidine synthase [Dokdonella sp.]